MTSTPAPAAASAPPAGRPAGPAPAAPLPPSATPPVGPVGRLLAQLRGALADAAPTSGPQRLLYLAGLVLVVSGVAHLGVLAVDGGGWEGPLSWRKPVLFGVSFGLSTLALGWVLGTLPPRRRWDRAAAGLVAVGAVVEVALVTAQAWRGTASHFNVAGDPVDETVFVAMGVSIGVMTLGVVLLAVRAVARLRGPEPTTVAVLVGLALLLAGSALGGDLTGRGLAYVDEHGTVPAAVVIGVAGSGKLAHAVALHGLQVLGVLALLLGRSGLTAGARRRAMALGASGYVALTALVAGQAYAGGSMLELSAPLAVATLLAASAVVAAVGWSLRDAVLGTRHRG